MAERKSDIRIEPKLLDAQSEYVGTPQGVLDLRTGKILSREDGAKHWVTKRLACSPGGRSELWERCMNEWTGGDTELSRYLQKLVGYSLLGRPELEQKFTFLHGPGANGKSSFCEVVLKAFGGYGVGVGFSTFLASHSERHPTELYSIRGRRLVVAEEPICGRKWNDAILKQFSAGGTISARAMRKNFVEFPAQAQLVFAGNTVPPASDMGKALERRTRIVPFRFKPAAPDQNLKAKLLDQLPGVLAWALEGLELWRSEGLGDPEAIRSETAEYVESQNWVPQFVKDRLEFVPIGTLYASDLQKEADAYCGKHFGQQMKEMGWSLTQFRMALGAILRDNGCKRSRPRNGTCWTGVRVKK